MSGREESPGDLKKKLQQSNSYIGELIVFIYLTSVLPVVP